MTWLSIIIIGDFNPHLETISFGAEVISRKSTIQPSLFKYSIAITHGRQLISP